MFKGEARKTVQWQVKTWPRPDLLHFLATWAEASCPASIFSCRGDGRKPTQSLCEVQRGKAHGTRLGVERVLKGTLLKGKYTSWKENCRHSMTVALWKTEGWNLREPHTSKLWIKLHLTVCWHEFHMNSLVQQGFWWTEPMILDYEEGRKATCITV